ncbi:MAG: transposase [Ferruginibacter sp.]
MKTTCPENWPQFYTATIYEWKPLLLDAQYKQIIIASLQFMVKEKRLLLYAFVIMNNHIHLIWQPLPGYSLYDIQASFMKYTGQQLKRLLSKSGNPMLDEFKANRSDREYQIWKRESLSTELFTPAVFNQKLEYIHNNPVKAGLCKYPEEYHYSSARFYFSGADPFDMLTHHSGN